MMAKSPIEALFDKTKMKCTICGKAKCDCWVECKCGWSFEKNTKCNNPDCKKSKKG